MLRAQHSTAAKARCSDRVSPMVRVPGTRYSTVNVDYGKGTRTCYSCRCPFSRWPRVFGQRLRGLPDFSRIVAPFGTPGRSSLTSPSTASALVRIPASNTGRAANRPTGAGRRVNLLGCAASLRGTRYSLSEPERAASAAGAASVPRPLAVRHPRHTCGRPPLRAVVSSPENSIKSILLYAMTLVAASFAPLQAA